METFITVIMIYVGMICLIVSFSGESEIGKRTIWDEHEEDIY